MVEPAPPALHYPPTYLEWKSYWTTFKKQEVVGFGRTNLNEIRSYFWVVLTFQESEAN